jgi:deoxyribose-phosphate aldolase
MTIARTIDHAVLHPTQTDHDLKRACRLARRLGVATVCVKPYAVPLAANLLADSQVGVSAVVAFPHGGAPTEVKARETEWVCRAGAGEVDMVVNLARVLEGDWMYVAGDVRAVVVAADRYGALTKVILETGLIPDDATKVRLCQVCEEAGARFVKTSTGFGFVKAADGSLHATGATEHDVQLLRDACSSRVDVKASGGIRTYCDARRMIELGASRLGTSATEAIVGEQERNHVKSESSHAPE